MRILLVDDEPLARLALQAAVERLGHEWTAAEDGEAGWRRFAEDEPDVLITDLLMPRMDGLELCRRARTSVDPASLYIIVLTARSRTEDIVAALGVGADDYVTKPFSPRELIARIRAVLRRGRQVDAKEKKASLKVGDLEIDRYRFEVRMKGRAVELTPKEFELLATLVGAPGRVFGREELLDIVWGRDGFVEPRTVDVHVARLRGKFTVARLEEPGIETVRGVGYRFRDKP